VGGVLREGCELAAADLIAEYRTANAAALVNGHPQQITGLNWHEAQLRAANGQTERAIRLFEHSRVTYMESDALYGQATVAFLKRDRAALQQARDALAALPPPPDFAQAARTSDDAPAKSPLGPAVSASSMASSPASIALIAKLIRPRAARAPPRLKPQRSPRSRAARLRRRGRK
jgi:hypothetical protein